MPDNPQGGELVPSSVRSLIRLRGVLVPEDVAALRVHPDRQRGLVSEPKFRKELSRLRSLAKDELSRVAEDPATGLTAKFQWPESQPSLSSMGRFVDQVDRETRRACALFSILVRERTLPSFVPQPISASDGGLQVVATREGSFELVASAYGILATIATSSPVAIVSLCQMLWTARASATRMLLTPVLAKGGRVVDADARVLRELNPSSWDTFLYESRETTTGRSLRIEAHRES